VCRVSLHSRRPEGSQLCGGSTFIAACTIGTRDRANSAQSTA
jgi:hypothetical protein